MADSRLSGRTAVVFVEQDPALGRRRQRHRHCRGDARHGEGRRAPGALPRNGRASPVRVHTLRRGSRRGPAGRPGPPLREPARSAVQTTLPDDAPGVRASRPPQRRLPDARLHRGQYHRNRPAHRLLRPEPFHQALPPSDRHDAAELPREVRNAEPRFGRSFPAGEHAAWGTRLRKDDCRKAKCGRNDEAPMPKERHAPTPLRASSFLRHLAFRHSNSACRDTDPVPSPATSSWVASRGAPQTSDPRAPSVSCDRRQACRNR